MSGVLGQALGRKKSATPVCVSSVKYSVSPALSGRHVKYVYDCVKPSFARWYMIFGRVNASASKMTRGSTACTRAISHSQKANGFVCGLSTRKMLTPCSIQKRNTLSSSCQSDSRTGVSKSNG